MSTSAVLFSQHGFRAAPIVQNTTPSRLSPAGREQTQGLDARTLFHLRDGRIEPGLQPLAVPVRAVVAPLRDSQATARLASAVREHIVPIAAETGVWLQDPKKYHSTLFHASSHTVCCWKLSFCLMCGHSLLTDYSLPLCTTFASPYATLIWASTT